MGTSLKAQGRIEGPNRRDESVPPRDACRPIRLLHADDPKLDALLQAEIGRKLRSYYADLLSEPVPQHFAELLTRLDRKH